MKKPAVNSAPKKTSAPAKSVEAYLAGVPREMRMLLKSLRGTIKAAAPQAEEIISYQIPTYKYHGPLVHFVACPKFCSFIVTSRTVLAAFKNELKGFDISGTTIHFSPEKPLPAKLINRIVKARVKENWEKAKKAN